jgi:hypothetical protein
MQRDPTDTSSLSQSTHVGSTSEAQHGKVHVQEDRFCPERRRKFRLASLKACLAARWPRLYGTVMRTLILLSRTQAEDRALRPYTSAWSHV